VDARDGRPAVTAKIPIRVTVNGTVYDESVEPRLLLADFLRDVLGLTGTHVGCEHGVCGACTILLDGDSARSCLTFAVQANGAEIVTVEGLGEIDALHPLQRKFREHHALQCGFCTPGMLITALDLLKKYPLASDDEIRAGLSGNLCRCTGYEHIVRAVRAAVEERDRAERDAGKAKP
jgi:carbon-monoxide dehydrogenase small subunit